MLASCGGGDATSTTEPDAATTQTGDSTIPDQTETTAATDITAAPSPEGVPDACGLIEAAELTALIGFDVGEGDPQSFSADRSICIYSGGAITAIEIAANYEQSRQLIEDDGRETEEISGLGNGAFFDPFGQVVALGDEFFVAITAAEDVEVLTEVAGALLTAAEG